MRYITVVFVLLYLLNRLFQHAPNFIEFVFARAHLMYAIPCATTNGVHANVPDTDVSYYPYFAVCGKTEYSAVGTICCNGTIRYRLPGAACCGTEVYYPKLSEKCIDGKEVKRNVSREPVTL